MASLKSRVIGGKTKLAGVIGWPVTHSLSPLMHNYWLAHYVIDGAYVPLPVKPEDLADVMKALPKMGFKGVNLTLPHKRLVLPMLDHIDDEAKMIGAVNTITIDAEGKLKGSNTDSHGFIKNIRPHLPPKKSRAVVVGAGGAARAVCLGLVKEGFAKVDVVNRTREHAEALAKEIKGVTVERWEDRSRILHEADLLVNATALGMNDEESLDIDLSFMSAQGVVTDIVYTPVMTTLLKRAKAQNLRIVDGLGMLMHQATSGFKSWFGSNPEVTPELRQYLLDSAKS